MQRYFVSELPTENQRFTITGEDVHHISRVMRMTEGDSLYAVFPDESSASASIESISADAIHCVIDRMEERQAEMPVHITIAHGLPKGDKLEWVFQKGTELGAYSFMPFHAARSIVKWDEKKGQKKIDRWSKIAKEAAEQSHRQRIPAVDAPCSFATLIKESSSFDKVIVAYEEQAKQGEASQLARAFKETEGGQSILMVIGPEGGLTEKEVQSLTDAGAVACAIGPRIVRSETAPLYLLAAASYHFELMR